MDELVDLSVILASAGVVVAVYEWIAVKTGWVPTVTRLIKSLGWPGRFTAVAVATLLLVDHFLWNFTTGWLP